MKVFIPYRGLVPCQVSFAYPWHDTRAEDKAQEALHTLSQLPLPADTEPLSVHFTRARRRGPFYVVVPDDVAVISVNGGPVIKVWRHGAPWDSAPGLNRRPFIFKRRGWVEESFHDFCRRVRLAVLTYRPGFPDSPA
ncbi:MAG: hypothetical protein AB7P76_12390 [Candidatus Melainabacteria bacterium]